LWKIVAAQLGRLAIAEDFLINCFPFLSNFIETLNTLNNSKSEQGTMCLQGGVRDQIEAVELTRWSASGRGGRAVDGLGRAREPSKQPHTVGRMLVEKVVATRSPHRPPPLEGKQNGITISPRCRRDKPCRIWFTVAPSRP
jgi:hypothetical protein